MEKMEKNIITEDYVSFETAKLLKEKGFDAKCSTYYISDDEIAGIPIARDFNNNGIFLSAPTLQMACKWLREVHNIIIVIEPHSYNHMEEKVSSYVFSIWCGDNYEHPLTTNYPTFEDAVDAALKHSLENLI